MQPKVLAATESRVECELHEGYPLRLVGAKGRRVQCIAGVLWITATNERADIFLKPGDNYVIPNGGLALAEAIGLCRMQVDLPRSFHYAGRRSRLGGGLARLAAGVRFALMRRKSTAGTA